MVNRYEVKILMHKNADKQLHTNKDQQETVIPKEKAVFWMDENGHWHNEGGRFKLKKVIHRFNSSIQKDAGGYFLTQINGNRREKTYFPYEDTALFAIDITKKSPIILRLNTGQRLPLVPENLYFCEESLYTLIEEGWVKFSERSLLKLSTMIDYERNPFVFQYQGKVYPIRRKTTQKRDN